MLYKVKVWDLPTRIFHVLLIICLLFMLYSGLKGGSIMRWHLKTGIILLILITFRIIWGFIGSDTAKFKNFVVSHKDILKFIKNGIDENLQPGHNPLGALMIISLISLILLQVLTGLITLDQDTYIYNGYLVAVIHNTRILDIAFYIHTHLFWLILFLSLIHIGVILYYKHMKHKNLITPMLTGNKYLNKPIIINIANNLKAIILLLIIIVCVLALLRYIP